MASRVQHGSKSRHSSRKRLSNVRSGCIQRQQSQPSQNRKRFKTLIQFHFSIDIFTWFLFNWGMKRCFKCGKTKQLNQFYKHPAMGDGHLGKCKICAKHDVSLRAGRLKNNPAWLAKERERCRIKQERYRKLGLAKPTTQAVRSKWAIKNKHKVMAHQISSRAVKCGIIKKPSTCECCGIKSSRLEKHHPDYARPLFVQWLCSCCHGKTRRKDNFDICP